MKQFKDLIQNFFAFGLYMFALQLILMPSFSNLLSAKDYSSVVKFVTITNIICLVMGDSFGLTELIISKSGKVIIPVKIKIIFFFFFSIFSFLVTIILFFILKLNSIFNLLLVLFILLNNTIRFYLYIYFRSLKYYRGLWYQNMGYLIGSVIGIFILKNNIFDSFLFSFALAEFVSCIFALFFLNKNNFKESKTVIKMVEVRKKYFEFASFSLMNNLIGQVDSIATFLIFSPTIVAAYYASSTVSKIVLLVIGPFNTWITATFSNKKINKEIFTKKNFLLLIGTIFLFSLIIITLTLLGMHLLYPNFLFLAKKIIVPIALTVSTKVIYSLISSYIIANYNPKILTVSRSAYFFSFCLLAIIFGKVLGIVFFVYGMFVSHCLSLLVLLINWRGELKNIDS